MIWVLQVCTTVIIYVLMFASVKYQFIIDVLMFVSVKYQFIIDVLMFVSA
jgi:hypothetical protein